jgi:protein-disulfide isomerase
VDFNAAGDPNAPITITEYSDFQCPYCKRFSDETEKQLVDAYVASGKVRFVYRSFGLFVGPESQAAAEAAYCAGDQNKYWEFHDILFANHTGENVGDYTNRKLQAFAEALGLNMTAFKSCLDSGKYAERVTQDGVDGVAAGVEATPSFVLSYTVNGETRTRLIQGAQPFGAFQTEIEAALAEMGK